MSNRAIYYITRKKKRSLIILIVVTVIFSSLYVSLNVIIRYDATEIIINHT